MSAASDPAAGGPHTPVLYQPVLAALQPQAAGLYVDGTVGAGGHAAGILAASDPDGALLGLDRDPAAIELAGQRLAAYGERVRLRHASFAELAEQVRAVGWERVDGVLLDLGVSSMQLESVERGFSFRGTGPLDMRLDPTQALTAAELVNELSEAELADLIHRYGEEPKARRVARAITAARPLSTTEELATVVAAAAGGRRRRIHPATRTFQALRIAVNDELAALETGLQQALQVLAPGGRLAVLAFHSLEDRIVKQFIRREAQDCICPPEQPVCSCDHTAQLRPVNRRPIRADDDEIRRNPRARSARLRVAERLRLA